MTKLRTLSLLAATMLLPASLLGQAPTTASIHGHVTNAAGLPQAGTVQLTTDKNPPSKDTKYKNTFPVDANGDYKGTGIAPDEYQVYFFSGAAPLDRVITTFKVGDDATVNFDMSRKEYIDKMSAEDKAALEEYKKKVAAAKGANAVVANLNAALKSVREDMATATPNYDQDIKTMQDAIVQKGDEPILWYNLGSAQIADGDSKTKAAKAAHTAPDETVTKLYSDGIDSYKKGIALNDAKPKPNAADAGIAWNAIGNASAKIGKIPEATEAFDNAVKLAPTTSAMVYSNEAAVLFNNGNGEQAVIAADKAIAADPTKPDPYFIKGQALVAKATVDSKGAIVAPPGCVEAYQKYLELAPDGPHAQDVKDVLTGMGQKITTTFKADKKPAPKKQ